MESWRKVWRDGFVPNLNLNQLQVLHQALEVNDPRLIQGATSTPPPLMCMQDWPIECGCLVTYCGVAEVGGFKSLTIKDYLDRKKSNPKPCTVGTAEEWFARLCFQADQLLGESAACRWVLTWFDDTPRDTMRRELLAELAVNIKAKEESHAAVSPAVSHFATQSPTSGP